MSKQTIFIPTQRDEGGEKYVPYCRFRFHPGVSRDHKTCEARKCTHYIRLYLNGSYQHIGNNSAPEACLNGLESRFGDGI